MYCFSCPGINRLAERVGRRTIIGLRAAKRYVLREPPDLTKPIRHLNEVVDQYEARERVLLDRASSSREAANRCVVDFKRSKNVSVKQAALQHLKTKSVCT